MRLTLDIYRVTAGFPKHELYGLVSQMRRAAVSIPSNIAEGKGHQTNREFNHFLYHARGSLLELQTQVLIAKELEYLSEERAEQLNGRADGVGRALNGLIKAFRTENALPEGRRTNDQRLKT